MPFKICIWLVGQFFPLHYVSLSFKRKPLKDVDVYTNKIPDAIYKTKKSSVLNYIPKMLTFKESEKYNNSLILLSQQYYLKSKHAVCCVRRWKYKEKKLGNVPIFWVYLLTREYIEKKKHINKWNQIFINVAKTIKYIKIGLNIDLQSP